jgi:mannose-6-phosphate isomerase
MSLDLSRPFRVLPHFKDRVWGVNDLMTWFPSVADRTIGEAWFTAQENQIANGPTLGELLKEKSELLGTGADSAEPGLCPLLVKLLFTSSRLSVQVHPQDEYARQHHQSLGKTEAWFIVEAEAGAEVALGFREEISRHRLRDASESGEIEHLLAWQKVSRGDVIFVPAGTVHAIGSGLTICEIQQNSDITYRLYDYGRPRELHLDHGCAVSNLGPYLHHYNPEQLGAGRLCVAESPYFRIEHLPQAKSRRFTLEGGLSHYVLLVCLGGHGTLNGDRFQKGQVWFVPANSKDVSSCGTESEWIITYSGTQPPPDIHIE